MPDYVHVKLDRKMFQEVVNKLEKDNGGPFKTMADLIRAVERSELNKIYKMSFTAIKIRFGPLGIESDTYEKLTGLRSVPPGKGTWSPPDPDNPNSAKRTFDRVAVPNHAGIPPELIVDTNGRKVQTPVAYRPRSNSQIDLSKISIADLLSDNPPATLPMKSTEKTVERYEIFYHVDGKIVHFVELLTMAFRSGFKGPFSVDGAAQWLREQGKEVVGVAEPETFPEPSLPPCSGNPNGPYLFNGRRLHFIEYTYQAFLDGYRGAGPGGSSFKTAEISEWYKSRGVEVKKVS